MRRWAKPKERSTPGQLSLLDPPRTIRERPRIETEGAAVGVAETSREAAVAVNESAIHDQQLILAMVRGRGLHGLTCDEAARAMGKQKYQISGRFTKLAELGLIQDSGGRRPALDGAGHPKRTKATVWVEVKRV